MVAAPACCAILVGIAVGEVTLAFRRKRAAAKPGETLRTSSGLLTFTSVEPIADETVRAGEAKLAGLTLGLTESLADGHRLSPRGGAYPGRQERAS